MTAIADQASDRISQLRPDELRDEFEIDLAPIWPADDDRLEPIFLTGPRWFAFEEFDPTPALGPSEAPLPVEFMEFLELDPQRSEEEPDEPLPEPGQRASATSHLGSLGLHLLVLIVLINWSNAPAGIPNAMPVQLAFEQSPSAPDETPPERSVAETISETPSKADSTAADTAPAPPMQPPQTKTVAVTAQPPQPSPPPKPSPPPEPAPRQPAAVTPPAPAPPAAAARSPAATPNPARREARVPGPDTARSDYFEHLVALTRHHLDMLPLSFLAGRRGQTILSIVVLEDGTIGRISVKRGSGYPDIDARIEQIVAAVGRFPPLPQSFGGQPSVELDFDMTFPNALQQ